MKWYNLIIRNDQQRRCEIGLLDRLSSRKGVRLGRLVIPKEELGGGGIDYMCLGDTKEAALDQVKYLRELTQIKLAEADWDALAPIPKYDQWKRPSIEWQESLWDMVCLLEEWKLEKEREIEERYAKKPSLPTVTYLISTLQEEGRYGCTRGQLADALADLGDIGSMVEVFPKTIKWGEHAYMQRGYVGTGLSHSIQWALTRISDTAATNALRRLRSLEIKGEPVHDTLEGSPELNISIAIPNNNASILAITRQR